MWQSLPDVLTMVTFNYSDYLKVSINLTLMLILFLTNNYSAVASRTITYSNRAGDFFTQCKTGAFQLGIFIFESGCSLTQQCNSRMNHWWFLSLQIALRNFVSYCEKRVEPIWLLRTTHSPFKHSELSLIKLNLEE